MEIRFEIARAYVADAVPEPWWFPMPDVVGDTATESRRSV
jgi:hypothetical protein